MTSAFVGLRESVLPWASFILGLLTFFWIGLRRDGTQLSERLRQASAVGKTGILFSFVLPYGVGLAAVVLLFLHSSVFRPIDIRNHKLHEIGAAGGKAVDLDRLMTVDLTFGSDSWPEIFVRGEIFGPEFGLLEERFGSHDQVLVYAVVEEGRNPYHYWLQTNEKEVGKLDRRGWYEARAHLGSDKEGFAKAKPGDTFRISICIPDRGVKLKSFPSYDHLGLLSKCSFLSEPLTVRYLAKELM